MNYLELLEIMIFILGLLFISSIQPLMMISLLIIIVLFYSYLIYSIMESYWFSYALVMVMLSGVLVIFTYMISLIPNESFESYNLVFVFFLMFILFGYFLYKNFYNMSYICLNLWSSSISLFNIFVVSFLLSIMLMVVWLSYLGKGAVRISF